MTARPRGAAAAELALWTAAGLLALTAHVGGAAWLLHTPRVVPADDMPPAAIMIEFAETAEAVSTENTEISPDLQAADASTPAQQVETPREEEAEAEPQKTELPREETPPVETVDEPVDETPVLDKVEVALPVTRPKPPEKKVVREEKEKPKRRQQAQAAFRQALQAQAQVTPSSRNAARQSASGAFSSLTPATWQTKLRAHLERRKTHPPGSRARGEQGTVYVRFSIDEGGAVLSVSLAGSSGFPDLDQEVLSLVRRASPVPAPPPGVNRTITAPVRFTVR